MTRASNIAIALGLMVIIVTGILAGVPTGLDRVSPPTGMVEYGWSEEQYDWCKSESYTPSMLPPILTFRDTTRVSLSLVIRGIGPFKVDSIETLVDHLAPSSQLTFCNGYKTTSDSLRNAAVTMNLPCRVDIEVTLAQIIVPNNVTVRMTGSWLYSVPITVSLSSPPLLANETKMLDDYRRFRDAWDRLPHAYVELTRNATTWCGALQTAILQREDPIVLYLVAEHYKKVSIAAIEAFQKEMESLPSGSAVPWVVAMIEEGSWQGTVSLYSKSAQPASGGEWLPFLLAIAGVCLVAGGLYLKRRQRSATRSETK